MLTCQTHSTAGRACDPAQACHGAGAVPLASAAPWVCSRARAGRSVPPRGRWWACLRRARARRTRRRCVLWPTRGRRAARRTGCRGRGWRSRRRSRRPTTWPRGRAARRSLGQGLGEHRGGGRAAAAGAPARAQQLAEAGRSAEGARWGVTRAEVQRCAFGSIQSVEQHLAQCTFCTALSELSIRQHAHGVLAHPASSRQAVSTCQTEAQYLLAAALRQGLQTPAERRNLRTRILCALYMHCAITCGRVVSVSCMLMLPLASAREQGQVCYRLWRGMSQARRLIGARYFPQHSTPRMRR